MGVQSRLAGSEPANPYLQSLISGYLWTGPIRVAFAEGPIRPGGRAGTGDPWFDYEQTAFYRAMAAYEAVANVDFQVYGDYSQADILWYSVDSSVLSGDTLASHGYPDGDYYQQFGYFRWDVPSWNYISPGGDGFFTIIHELGHGLGLEHPHLDDADTASHVAFPGVDSDGDTGDYGLNQAIWSIMSYNSGWDEAGTALGWGHVMTPMAFDIAALQVMYGANTSYHNGIDYYYLGPETNVAGTGWACIWDTGGIDTITADGANTSAVIDLRAATLAAGDPWAGGRPSYYGTRSILGGDQPVAAHGFTIANGVVIENAHGGNAADNITGNAVANVLEGRRGNDFLDGLEGDDTLNGGEGDDSLKGGGGYDTLIGGAGADTFNGGSGYDSVYYDNTYWGQIQVIDMLQPAAGTLDGYGDSFTEVERIYGSAGEDWIRGTDGNESLNGRDGGDRLYGRNGSDVLDGGAGFDLVVYTSPVISDLMFTYLNTGEAAGDQFISIEGLRGSTGSDDLRGDAGDNGLSGDEGSDLLRGRGGNDTLEGGIGSDTLWGDQGSDLLVGGTGTDTMYGGAGDDTYILDLNTDVVVEYANEGYDTIGILSVPHEADGSRSYTLPENANVERVEADGTLAVNITGNSQDNELQGSFGPNRLLGMGGNDNLNGWIGSDWLDGGTGDDVVMVGNRAGTDTYVGGAGSDTLAFYYDFDEGLWFDLAIGSQGFGRYVPGTGWVSFGSITYSEFENVRGGAGDDTIYGDSGNNRIEGGTGGHDTLSGRDGDDRLEGGLGFDSLYGEAGDDTLVGIYEYSLYGVDFMDGGADSDTADFSAHGQAVWIDLMYNGREVWTRDAADVAAGTWRQVADLVSVENLIGTAGADQMWGDDGANRMIGGAGNDRIDGRGGDDRLEGGVGFDSLLGGAGDDTLVGTYEYSVYGVDFMDGGADSDTADFSAHGQAVWIDLMYNGREVWTRDAADLAAGAWRQVADLVSVENLIGTAGADQMWGDANDNTFFYTGGLDRFDGRSGTDTADFSLFGSAVWVDLAFTNTPNEAWTQDDVDLAGGTWREIADLNNIENVTGSAHADTLWGNGGINRLEGGAGNDTLTGRGGSDIFVFRAGFAADIVTDFNTGVGTGDVLDLSLGPAFDSVAEVLAVATQAGNAVVFNFGAGDQLTLSNTQLSSLGTSHFLFA